MLPRTRNETSLPGLFSDLAHGLKQSSSGSVDLHGAHFRGWNKYAGTYPAKMRTVVLIFADGARANLCAGARLRGNVGKYQNGTSYTRVSARHNWNARAPL